MSKLFKTRKAAGISIGGTIGGVALLAASYELPRLRGAGSSTDWVSGLLLELGASVLLFVPLYWITLTLERDIEAVRDETVASVDQVREATVASVDQVRADAVSSVQELTERVSAFEGDVTRRLEDVTRSVYERLDRKLRAGASLHRRRAHCADP